MTTARPVDELVFVVAGAIDQKTGGYLYDARMVRELRDRGRRIRVVELEGAWPAPDSRAIEGLRTALRACPDGALVVVDGLVGGAAPGPIEAERDRLRVVALVHHPLCDEGPERDGLAATEARTLTAAAGVIVTSAFTAGRVVELGADPASVRVVEPGTGPGWGTEAIGDPGCDGADAPDRPVELLSVGSVVPRKGQADLVRALEHLAAAAPELEWRCRIVGSLERDPAYAAALAEAVARTAARSHVGSRIELTGEVGDDELRELWRAADVFVSASRYEGYGMALTEAMIHGLPVVAVAGGAVRSTVPADVGVLVARGAATTPVAELADALARVAGDPRFRVELAARSAAHARTLPDWSAQAAAFEAALRELADV